MDGGGMSRLSITDAEGTSPDLTSRTPPPPGFDNPSSSNLQSNLNPDRASSVTTTSCSTEIDHHGLDSRSGTPNTCKSTSFNNLAMALGTGLAESMDQGMDGSDHRENTNAGKDPNRIHTPDGYARQSRHSVSRMMGSGQGVGGGGFDYLNPSATSHLLIPPSNQRYLNKLKEQQQGGRSHLMQQQAQNIQSQGQGSVQAGSMGLGNANQVNGGSQPLLGSNIVGGGQGQSSLQQAAVTPQAGASTLDQKPVRFTAAMMANAGAGTGASAADAAAFQLMSNQNATLGSQAGTGDANSANNSHQLNQELLRQQLMHQSSNISGINSSASTSQANNLSGIGSNAFGRSNSNTVGVTVVEPSSTRNSPAPQRGAAQQMIGVNGEGLLYPLVQQGMGQKQINAQQLNAQLTSLSAATANSGSGNDKSGQVSNNIVLNPSPAPGIVSGSIINLASGGRASAPPPQSQHSTTGPFVPGGMTHLVMNNAAIRAYTASSLQMRVAELHQELGSKGGVIVNNAGNIQAGQVTGVPVAAPTGTVIRTLPAGAIPIVLAPAPTPVRPPSRDGVAVVAGRATPVPLRPLSRSGDPLLNKQVSRSTTPASTITNLTPNPTTLNVGNNPAPQAVQAAPTIDPDQQKMEDEAMQDLTPFLRDANSSASTRGLAVLRASSLHVTEVRSTCEAFGALESFRSDFGDSRGVYFATYYDLRSAQLAAGELPKVLNKGNPTVNGGGRAEVRYCVPLNSSSACDESTLMLSNLPGTTDERDLTHLLSSFGGVRAVHYQAGASTEDDEGNELASYMAEFYDVQDARQALLELEQTNPWGDKARIKVGARSPAKRKQGRDLIMLMSSWRQGVTSNQKGGKSGGSRPPSRQDQSQKDDSVGNTVSPTPSPSPPQQVVQVPHQQQQMIHLQQQDTSSSQTARTSHVNHHHNHHHPMQAAMQQQLEINQNNSMTSAPSASTPQSYYQQQQQYPNHHNPAAGQHLQPQQYQLVVGPDGQYSYALMNQGPAHHHPQIIPGHHHPFVGQHQPMLVDPMHQQQQHIMYAQVDPQQQHYMAHNPHLAAAQQYHIQMQQQQQQSGLGYIPADAINPPTQFVRMPSHDVNSSSLSSGSQSGLRSPVKRMSSHSGNKSGGSIGSGSSGGNNSGGAQHQSSVDDENANLALNIEDVRSGRDRRSSLMVRNIPNKYTQRMLLDEFASAGHGPDKMDFFYLPIDFKNKCNRGYAFVNFVEYSDVVPFVEGYNGRGWRRFNSDKICDVTYARIQGKAAMMRRFENSALMEKDDEYRPKVFVSHGERKGEVEVMPTTAR